MPPRHHSSPPLRTVVIALVLVLSVAAPPTVAAVGAPSAAEHPDTMTAPTVGNLSATLPPPAAEPDDIRSAAESDSLAPTDAVNPNGTVVFRLNGRTAAEPTNDSTLADELRFGMRQTPHSTSPERLPLRLNASRSGDAVRTFVVDADRYVVVDLPNATWEYDGEPGTHALEPRPRAGQAYTATLAVTSNGTTVSRNATVRVTEPGIANGSEVIAGSVAQLNVSVPGTWTATVVLGTESAGVRAAIQVVDEDADGVVRVRIDTDAPDPEAAFTAAGPDTVRQHPAADGFAIWNGSLPPGEYRLGAGVGDPETVAADRYRWAPALTVVEPAPGSPTATATASQTPTESPTPTRSPTPTESPTPTRSPTPTGGTTTVAVTTTDSPGLGAVPAVLALLVVVFVAREDWLDS